MRLFFAVVLPDDVIDRVKAVQDDLRKAAGDEGIRWTQPHQFHYTVKFLGEQPPARVPKAVEAAKAVCEPQARFTVELGGAGAFPNAQRPSVLWVGTTAGMEEMEELAGRLDKMLSRQGFPRENRPFKAHLTLARVKTWNGEAAASRAIRAAQVGSLGTVEVDRLVLMQSTLKPTGSVYDVVEEFAFGRQAADS